MTRLECRDADACGGRINRLRPEGSTPMTGHQMALRKGRHWGKAPPTTLGTTGTEHGTASAPLLCGGNYGRAATNGPQPKNCGVLEGLPLPAKANGYLRPSQACRTAKVNGRSTFGHERRHLKAAQAFGPANLGLDARSEAPSQRPVRTRAHASYPPLHPTLPPCALRDLSLSCHNTQAVLWRRTSATNAQAMGSPVSEQRCAQTWPSERVCVCALSKIPQLMCLGAKRRLGGGAIAPYLCLLDPGA